VLRLVRLVIEDSKEYELRSYSLLRMSFDRLRQEEVSRLSDLSVQT
jgi:hypothetical protein